MHCIVRSLNMMISGILNPLLADIDSAASINSRVGVDPISVHLAEPRDAACSSVEPHQHTCAHAWISK